MVSDRRAERELECDVTPDHVAVVFGADAAPTTVRDFYVWCEEFGVVTATACLPDVDDETRSSLEDLLTDLKSSVRGTDETEDGGEFNRFLSYVGGREEIVDALRRLAEDVESGEVEAADIDFAAVEDRLKVPGEPDLLIDVTEGRLTDVLIWQTAYSELCHVEEFDRSTFVRCLYEYKERERRFGR